MRVDLRRELEAREAAGRPIQVCLVGAGQMGTDIVSQVSRMQGIRIAAVVDRILDRAVAAYKIADPSAPAPVVCSSAAEAGLAMAEGRPVASADFRAVVGQPEVDVVIDATGVPNVAVQTALMAIAHRKGIVMMSVEADITVGPLLKWYADRVGAVYSLAAGDEPAAIMELYEFCKTLGLEIVAAGKGKNNPLDREATPDQWKAEADRRGLLPEMLVEFVDGSKTEIEMAAVANATGLTIDVRGMHGPKTSLKELAKVFSTRDQGGLLSRSGVVDYAIGAISPGVFVIATTDHPRLKECLVLRDMGHGPNYLFYRPYHLCSMEVPLTCANIAINGLADMAPQDHLVAEVMTFAKCDLEAGRKLDRIGGYCYYGLADTREAARKANALPLGLAQGAVLKRAIKKGEMITLDDVEMPDSILWRLRQLQDAWEAAKIGPEELAKGVRALVPTAH